MNWKVGFSSDIKNLDEDLMRQYAENGIEFMELFVPGREYADADYPKIAKLAQKYGVKIRSLHLPFSDGNLVNPANPDEKIFHSTLEIDKILIEKAAILGCEVIVIHGCRGPVEPEDRPKWIAQAKRTLSILADFADEFGIRIAVENQPRNALIGSSATMLKILEADHRLGVCFDVNHLMKETETHENFIRACGRKIIALHISDYDFLNERHWLPGEGKIDWQKLVKELEYIEYRGPWMYELDLQSPMTIERPRDLTLADIKENANRILSGMKPVPFGTPVPNLAHWTVEEEKKRNLLR